MDLDELRVFMAALEHGSVARAAARLGLSRGTARRRLEALQARIGAPLWRRVDGALRPTPAGAAIQAAAPGLLGDAQSALGAARTLAAQEDALRIALPTGLAPLAVLRGLDVVLPLLDGAQHTVLTADDPCALSPPPDLAVRVGPPARPEQWQCIPLMPVHLWVVASPAYLERAGTPQQPADLAAHRLFAWTGIPEGHRAWPTPSGGSVPVTPYLLMNDLHLLRQVAAAGHGLVLSADAELPGDHDLGPLEVVLRHEIGAVLDVTLCLRRDAMHRPVVAKLARLFASLDAQL